MTFEDKTDTNSSIVIVESDEELLFVIYGLDNEGRSIKLECKLDKGQVFELNRSVQEWLKL